MEATSMLTLDKVNLNIQEKTILKDIHLSIEKGEILSIIGPSGAGKSTLLRVINLLVHPQSGTYHVADQGTYAFDQLNKEETKRIRSLSSMVFQQYGLFENKTVLENIMLPVLHVKKITKEAARKLTENLLEQVGLLDKQAAYPQQLSGGQQQRVGIARALAMEPKILLLDEPTSALDPELVNDVLRLIKELSLSHEYTMLIVTHEMNFAKRISDRIVFMDQGEIVETGTPEVLLKQPKEKRVKDFLLKINESWD